MRDRFKFRHWDKQINRMRFGDVQLDCDGKPFIITSKPIFPHQHIDDVVTMFCTGLKDKNGKLIYEGDIVNVFVDSIKPHYIPHVVIWDRKEWQLAQQNKNYKKCENCANRNKTKCSYCKEYFMSSGHTNFKDFYNGFVIGNIYENPELLEAKND